MPRPTTGAFREPGSSLPNFVPPLTASSLAEALDQLARDARQRQSANADRALQALSGTDPVLFPVSSTVRARVTGLLRRQATEWARARAHPERRFMNEAGIARQEQEIRGQFAKEFAELESELTSKLEEITAGLAAKLDALTTSAVTEDDWRSANEFADRLTRLGPELGLRELVALVDQAGTEERSRGELKALLPILEAAYRHPTSPWRGRDEIRRVVAIGESLTDGGVNASILSARLERAQKLAGDLQVFMMIAKDGNPAALEAHVTGDADPDRPHGSYSLFPEQPAPLGPALEDREDWRDTEPKPFRRVAAGTISPEQRAADEAARAAQQ
jgi:hypothetical protein